MSDLDTMWELQSLLSQLADRERQMSVKPESFAAIDREYQEATTSIEQLNQQLETAARERRRVEGELSDQQELLKKYQGQLMQVKNQQQYAAAWKEIDATRKHVKELEDSLLKLMGDSDGVQAQLDERKGGYDGLKQRYDEAYEAWQHSLADLRKDAEDLKVKAADMEKRLPMRLRNEFQKIFRQRQGIAVAKTNGDTCTVCRTRVRPQVAQQLRRGETVFCEGCHRILYLEKVAS